MDTAFGGGDDTDIEYTDIEIRPSAVGKQVRLGVWNAILLFNRPVSYSNGWTGSSMKWRLMRAN